MKNMKRITAFLLAAILLCCAAVSALADDVVKVQVKANAKRDDAKKMLTMINKFRTGSDAWYIAEDNKTRITVSGLKELTYDPELEKVAMLRAKEIAVYFSHTRPDGTGWGTAFPDAYKTKGENLAYGYGTADSAFKALAEEDKDYSGQGHRRNMLRKEFTRVGFGAVKVGNVMYWVQSFGAGNVSSNSKSNSYKSGEVQASADILKKSAKSITPDLESLAVAVGESVSLPRVLIHSNSGAKIYLSTKDWKSKDKKVAKIKSGKVTGVKKGDTSLELSVFGKKLVVPVEVTKKAGKKEVTEIIEDYDPPLAIQEYVILEDGDECFEIGDDANGGAV